MMADAVPPPLAAVFAGLFGGVVGSFLNVCIHRLPRGLSVVAPRSACPRCGEPIAWFRNIPVFSWLALGGRAACCGGPISLRYPLVELATALAAVTLFLQHGLSFETLARFVFLSALIVLFFTDLDLRLLPDLVTLPATAAGLALSFARTDVRPMGAFLAAAAGAAGLLAIAVLWRNLRGVEAVGGGDVKMMAMMGAFLGPAGLFLAVLCGSTLGAAAGCAIAWRWASRRADRLSRRLAGRGEGGLRCALFLRGLRRLTVPFGCFLAVGAVLAQFLGAAAIRWYSSLLW